MMRRVNGAVLFILFSLCSCYKSSVNNSSTCSYDPCALIAPQNEVANLQAYLSANNITNTTRHCSGIFYQVTKSGADKTPGICSDVTVNYKGMLTDGTVFDQTTTAPATFPLISLIEGWKKGLPLIKKGGSIRLYVPPSLGYGDQARPSIPANSILVFDIDLVDVQ